MTFIAMRRTFKVGTGTALLVLLAVFFVAPLAWLFLSTTKSTQQLFSLPVYKPPAHISLGQNVSSTFSVNGGTFSYWLVNSAIYGVVISVGSTYLSTLCGYAIAKLRFPGKRLISGSVVGSLMIPTSVLVIPLFVLERAMRLTNTYQGVILPSLVSAFGVFFMMVYVEEAVPTDLIEQARIDGAGEMRIFRRIALPLLRPGLVTLVLILFVAAWNNFFLPLVLLQNANLFPIPVGVDVWLGQLSTGGSVQPLYPEILIASVISVLPLLLLFPLLHRYVTRGFTLGALAGQ
jgi:multiple sugar transport system permease protein